MLMVLLSYHLHVDKNTTYCRITYNIVCNSLWFRASIFIRNLFKYMTGCFKVPSADSPVKFYHRLYLAMYLFLYPALHFEEGIVSSTFCPFSYLHQYAVGKFVHACERLVLYLSVCWWHSSRVHWDEEWKIYSQIKKGCKGLPQRKRKMFYCLDSPRELI